MSNKENLGEELEELYKKGVPMGDGIIMENPYLRYAREQLIGFIQRKIISTRQEENDRWLNQPANEHDKRIRQDERTKVLVMIEDLTQRYFDSLLKEDFLKQIADLQKKLENDAR